MHGYSAKDPIATRGPQGARRLDSSPHDPAAAQVERARIVLGSAAGLSGRALAREIGVSLPTVQRWLDRYDGGRARGT